jgi:murein DD-endopeptidase MepM/ murein hydrolase activator NlpD
LIENKTGFICKYAELGEVVVAIGKQVKAGQLIAHVGSVLNADRIHKDSPPYIQELKKKGNLSMLHFELYDAFPLRLGNIWAEIGSAIKCQKICWILGIT